MISYLLFITEKDCDIKCERDERKYYITYVSQIKWIY